MYFPNGTTKVLSLGTEGVIGEPLKQHSMNDRDIYTRVTVVAAQTWNNTVVRCFADYGAGSLLSNNATLVVYTSLSESAHNSITE